MRTNTLIIATLASIAAGSGAMAQRAPTDGKAAAPPSFTAISPIFSQLVMFAHPSGFKVLSERPQGSRYIREAVPAGQSLQQWTEMITVTGAKDLAKNPAITPKGFVEQISSGFKQACPQTFTAKPIATGKLGEHEMFAAIASCGHVKLGGPERSETALLIAIRGTADLYTIQWAERGPSSLTALAIDDAKWQARFRQLAPMRLCPIVTGEAAPYPSCINRK